MKKVRVGINGFGRIGRCVLRSNLESELIEIVAINDIAPIDCCAHLIKYDSTYGIIPQKVESNKEKCQIIIDGHVIQGFVQRDPAQIPWEDAGVDIVLECTGFFTKYVDAAKHLKGTVKKVIISAPVKDDVEKTIVMGVNEDSYDPAKHHVISNASCTTNCLAPLVKVLHDEFEVQRGLMTTIHSYTGDQRLLDAPHEDFRRARSACLSMVPTSTGAAKAIGQVLPELNGKLNGIAIRVPTPTVSLTDFTCELAKKVTAEEVNAAMKKASEGKMKGILEYMDQKLVSVDFRKNTHSSIFDANETTVIDGNLVKVLSWYDNEWGYATRMVELTKFLGDKL